MNKQASGLSSSLFKPEMDLSDQLLPLLDQLSVCLNGAKSDLTTLSRFVSQRPSSFPSGLTGSNTGVRLDPSSVSSDLKGIDTILNQVHALSSQIKPQQWRYSAP